MTGVAFVTTPEAIRGDEAEAEAAGHVEEVVEHTKEARARELHASRPDTEEGDGEKARARGL